MKPIHLYRALLYLYPADFRCRFSAEMQTVFEQTLRDRPTNTPTLLLRECFSIVKGAYIMWLTRPSSSSPTPITTADPLTIQEITNLRHAAIKEMCAAIAGHDFRNARRCSDEEARLQHLLGEMQTRSITA